MNKIFKNRIFIVLLCCIVAFGCIFLYSNSIKSEAEKVTAVRVISNISKGDKITDKMIETVTVGGYNLTQTVAKSKEDVVGKYAAVDMVKGDYVLAGKVSDTILNADDRLSNLDGNRVALSITIKDFANGLSDKLLSGDIVTVIVGTKEKTFTPSELTYVEVLSTTTGKGVDKKEQTAGSEESDNLKTATLLVTPEQAVQLAGYEDNAEIHLALVYRGDEQTAQKFISKQSEVLMNAR